MSQTVCRVRWLAVLVLVLCAPLLCRASETDSGRRDEIQKWVRLLADREPQARASARQSLLGLRRAELAILRDVVASLPRRPAQVQPLEEIVTYVITRASLGEMPHSGEAFLGVSLPSEYDSDDLPDVGLDAGSTRQTPPAGGGVPIINRLTGFIAYRFLEDGDVIESVGFGGILHPTHGVQEFRSAIREAKAGQDVTFRIRRAARMLEVTFEFDAKALVDPAGLRETIQNAMSRASDYWQQTFAPLVDPEQM